MVVTAKHGRSGTGQLFLTLCCVAAVFAHGCDACPDFGAEGGAGLGLNESGQGFVIGIQVVPTGIGRVSKTPDKPSYQAGEVVTLKAEGDVFNVVFGQWFGDVSGCENPVQVTVNKNLDIIAGFVEVPPR